MARKNKKPAIGTNAPHSKSDSLVSFDEQALLALTAKIENRFGKNSSKTERLGQGSPEGSKASRSSKPEKSSKSQKSNIKECKGESKTKAPELVRGTKRDASGKVKIASNSAGKSKTQPSKGRDDNGKDDRATLLQEILALGGTKEDLDLVADAVSEDEDDETSTTKSPDKSLRKELASFVAGLGIEGQVQEDTDSGAEEEVEDGWEEASGSDDSGNVSESADPKKIAEVPAKKAESTSVETHLSSNPNRLVFEARPDWHAAPLAALPSPDTSNPSRFQIAISNLKAYAKVLLEADSILYASKHLSSSSSHRFLSTIMASGTLSDKVSALTLVVQESPVHTTKSFESLLTLAKKNSRAQAVTALGALKDLLGMGLVLPADRRLRSFAGQPGLIGALQEDTVTTWYTGQQLPGDISKAHLIAWAYEDWLKDIYFDMLKVLEGWCNDEVEFARLRAVTYVYELLKEKPEQEANLLRLLVNKLGDPDKKIASRTSYLLLQLQTSHPLMKPIIVRSIESELLLRPGQSSHAKYYAINTLNQTILSGREEETAKMLLGIYFELFVALLKKPEPKVVVGPPINRKGQVQGGGAPMGKKAKAKATKEEEAKLISEETTEKMISAVLTGVNRAFPFSKSDDTSLEKHMDTLFKITHSSNFNTSVQALMLIEQLSTSKHLAVDRFYRTLYESLLDPRLVTSSKHALYLNLLFRALRTDLNIKRVKAFVKRMLQIVTLHQPPFICGILFLIRELEATFPGLKSLLSDPEEREDADEVFHDAPEGDVELGIKDCKTQSTPSVLYDGRKRDPEHSSADKSCLWELVPFMMHFHPSVSLFASRLLNDEKMPPKPDLMSHTLTNFLDRFVYRNAKASAGGAKGGSIMQPLSGGDSKGILLSSRSAGKIQQPVNTEGFWKKKVEDVAVNEVFFHKYFNQIGKSKRNFGKGKVPARTSGDAGDEEDEQEDEIWQALVDSRPEVEGNQDSDMDMLDLDDSDMGSDMDDMDDMEVDVESDDDRGREAEYSGSEASGGAPIEASDSEGGSDIDELFAEELQTAQPKDTTKGDETSKQRKKKFKSLPTFASAEDYADMLDNEEGEDVG
ncbi:related to MAK21-protein required for 60S ribosomal subunit biogenesis [Rhynchosporium agropyri]|uniref:Related to MAK21-protein required for 60S ribosomal subunit biogenesis n=1 Tax=Rhynchosporium agropyri TaxID=914238 RepID=A0A1E1L3G6_9HELO|nr:related to MAK21-protein required for 60S ribosomal subunit biogenesis [Rhynchosporium agropyri]